MEYGVVIVGAGPAGATLARLLAGSGRRILLVDQRRLAVDPGHGEVVVGKCCGGLLAPDAQAMMSRLALGLPCELLGGPQLFAVHAMDLIRGHRVYHVSMGVSGGVPLARVNNLLQSWIDVEKLTSRRFIQDQNEVRTKRFRQFEFFPEERRWERADVDEEGDLPTDLPLDDISFVYYVRSLPLEVGETYTLDRYFQERGNPVIVKVVRRDRIEVPAGTFNTIVVQPIIQTRGLFGAGGEAEIHFSDDDRRLLVQMRSRVPIIGSLSLHLTDVSDGRPLRHFSAAAIRQNRKGPETRD